MISRGPCAAYALQNHPSSLLAGTANGLTSGPHIAGYPRLINPIGWHGSTEILTRIADFSILPGGLALLGVVASMVVRYRRSWGIERQQLKFFFFVACLTPIPLILHVGRYPQEVEAAVYSASSRRCRRSRSTRVRPGRSSGSVVAGGCMTQTVIDPGRDGRVN